MDTHKKNFIIQALRRASYRWKGRWQAENRSKMIREVVGKRKFYDYFCEECGLVIEKKNSQMDHVLPIVDPKKGFEGFSDEYMDRFFPYADGWQRLCKPCHAIKTAQENDVRTETKKGKKYERIPTKNAKRK